MPLVVPGLLAVGVYSFLMTWDDYLHAITLIRSNDLWTLSQGLKLTYLGEVSDWQLINSASTLGTVPMIFVFSSSKIYDQRSYSRSSERLKGENRYVGDERK